jgi:hypothetical protein
MIIVSKLIEYASRGAIIVGLFCSAATSLQAAPQWSGQDDVSFVQAFVQSYTLRQGYPPTQAIINASLSCHRYYYNAAAAAGYDLHAAINYAMSSCLSGQAQGPRPSLGQSGASGSKTLFNSSGDASLSTDNDGCMYYSSGSYSFSNC